jgi:hypothetical protein
MRDSANTKYYHIGKTEMIKYVLATPHWLHHLTHMSNYHGSGSLDHSLLNNDRNNLDPIFSTPVIVDYYFETVQHLKFVVVDVDKPNADLQQQDFIGEMISSLHCCSTCRDRPSHGELIP